MTSIAVDTATFADRAGTPPLRDPLQAAGEDAARSRLSHIRLLEAESIHIIREVASEFQRPVMLYSIGKDSSVMLRLAQKAFHPGADSVSASARRHRLQIPRDARIPRPLHCRAGPQTHRVAQRRGTGGRRQPYSPWHAALLRPAQDSGAARRPSCARISTLPSAARGATKKSPAPRSASSPSATAHGQWDPKNQRPELWNLFNGRIGPGESIRVFPLSNWTELDIWHYIHLEKIPDRSALSCERAPHARARRLSLIPGRAALCAGPAWRRADGSSAACVRSAAALAPAPSVPTPIRFRKSLRN